MQSISSDWLSLFGWAVLVLALPLLVGCDYRDDGGPNYIDVGSASYGNADYPSAANPSQPEASPWATRGGYSRSFYPRRSPPNSAWAPANKKASFYPSRGSPSWRSPRRLSPPGQPSRKSRLPPGNRPYVDQSAKSRPQNTSISFHCHALEDTRCCTYTECCAIEMSCQQCVDAGRCKMLSPKIRVAALKQMMKTNYTDFSVGLDGIRRGPKKQN